MDGYSIIQKANEIMDLIEKQDKLNSELSGVSKEIADLPDMPKNMEEWMTSLPDLNSKNNFKLSDYGKLFKMSKKYSHLLEKREENSSKIKLSVIDTLIERINLTLK